MDEGSGVVGSSDGWVDMTRKHTYLRRRMVYTPVRYLHANVVCTQTRYTH